MNKGFTETSKIEEKRKFKEASIPPWLQSEIDTRSKLGIVKYVGKLDNGYIIGYYLMNNKGNPESNYVIFNIKGDLISSGYAGGFKQINDAVKKNNMIITNDLFGDRYFDLEPRKMESKKDSGIQEEVDVNKIIKDLSGDFSGSNEEQMKGLQLLKGLATSDDPKSNEFMKKLDKATTQISKSMTEKKENVQINEASNVVKGLAKDSGKSEKEVEKAWDEAIKIAEDEFGKKESKFSDKEYSYVTGIVKNMLGMKESYKKPSFKEYLNMDMGIDEYMDSMMYPMEDDEDMYGASGEVYIDEEPSMDAVMPSIDMEYDETMVSGSFTSPNGPIAGTIIPPDEEDM